MTPQPWPEAASVRSARVGLAGGGQRPLDWHVMAAALLNRNDLSVWACATSSAPSPLPLRELDPAAPLRRLCLQHAAPRPPSVPSQRRPRRPTAPPHPPARLYALRVRIIARLPTAQTAALPLPLRAPLSLSPAVLWKPGPVPDDAESEALSAEEPPRQRLHILTSWRLSGYSRSRGWWELRPSASRVQPWRTRTRRRLAVRVSSHRVVLL